MNQAAKNYMLTEDRIISEAELKLLLKTMLPVVEKAVRDGTNLHVINDHYLVLLASLTGLRISEIASIRIGDIHEHNITVVGKGRKKRNVPLGSRGKRALKDFIALKGDVLKHSISGGDYLFTNRLGRPFDRFSIGKRFAHWVQRAGISEHLTFHSLRHYYATMLLNNGFNLSEVQRMLGHASISTCGIYLHFTKSTQDRVAACL